jgi:endonuclease YncB( thermonuclease family)
MKYLFSILMTLLFLTAFCQDTIPKPSLPPGRFIGTIKSVHDGDTYGFTRDDGTKDRIRLAWVDCPELFSPPYVLKAQPFGVQTGNYVRELIGGKRLLVDSLSTDIYGRQISLVYVPMTDSTFLNLSALLVQNGYAWVVKKGTPPDAYLTLRQAQKTARDSKLGLWALPGRKYTPAWWRKNHGKKVEQ